MAISHFNVGHAMSTKTHCNNGHIKPPLPTAESRNECLTCKAIRSKEHNRRHAKPWTADRTQANDNGHEEILRAQRVLHLTDCKWQASTVWERNDIQAQIDALTTKETQCRPSTT